jgi:hypothetical protein
LAQGKLDDFFEYDYVIRHTRDLNRLKWLFRTRATSREVNVLYVDLCEEFELPFPNVRFTRRTDRGLFEVDGSKISLRSSNISVELAIHELAHHWMNERIGWGNSPNHGWDFVMRLDKLAAETEKHLTKPL